MSYFDSNYPEGGAGGLGATDITATPRSLDAGHLDARGYADEFGDGLGGADLGGGLGGEYGELGAGRDGLGDRAAGGLGDGYGAEGYGAENYGADGYGADGYGADGYGADGYGADGYGADGLGASEYGADGLGASEYGADGLGASEYGADGLGASEYGADGYGANGYDADGYGADGHTTSGLDGYGADRLGTDGYGAEGQRGDAFDLDGREQYGGDGLDRGGYGADRIEAGDYGRDGLGLDDYGPDGLGADGFGADGYGPEREYGDGLDRQLGADALGDSYGDSGTAGYGLGNSYGELGDELGATREQFDDGLTNPLLNDEAAYDDFRGGVDPYAERYGEFGNEPETGFGRLEREFNEHRDGLEGVAGATLAGLAGGAAGYALGRHAGNQERDRSRGMGDGLHDHELYDDRGAHDRGLHAGVDGLDDRRGLYDGGLNSYDRGFSDPGYMGDRSYDRLGHSDPGLADYTGLEDSQFGLGESHLGLDDRHRGRGHHHLDLDDGHHSRGHPGLDDGLHGRGHHLGLDDGRHGTGHRHLGLDDGLQGTGRHPLGLDHGHRGREHLGLDDHHRGRGHHHSGLDDGHHGRGHHHLGLDSDYGPRHGEYGADPLHSHHGISDRFGMDRLAHRSGHLDTMDGTGVGGVGGLGGIGGVPERSLVIREEGRLMDEERLADRLGDRLAQQRLDDRLDRDRLGDQLAQNRFQDRLDQDRLENHLAHDRLEDQLAQNRREDQHLEAQIKMSSLENRAALDRVEDRLQDQLNREHFDRERDRLATERHHLEEKLALERDRDRLEIDRFHLEDRLAADHDKERLALDRERNQIAMEHDQLALSSERAALDRAASLGALSTLNALDRPLRSEAYADRALDQSLAGLDLAESQLLHGQERIREMEWAGRGLDRRHDSRVDALLLADHHHGLGHQDYGHRGDALGRENHHLQVVPRVGGLGAHSTIGSYPDGHYDVQHHHHHRPNYGRRPSFPTDSIGSYNAAGRLVGTNPNYVGGVTYDAYHGLEGYNPSYDDYYYGGISNLYHDSAGADLFGGGHGRSRGLHADPFAYEITLDYGYGRIQPLSRYGLSRHSLRPLDALRLDDLYLFEQALRADLALNEVERLRRWHERLRWEELSDAQRRARWIAMAAEQRAHLGLGNGGWWASRLGGHRINSSYGYVRPLTGAGGLLAATGFRRGAFSHYPLTRGLSIRYPMWRRGGVGLGRSLLKWLQTPRHSHVPSRPHLRHHSRSGSFLAPKHAAMIAAARAGSSLAPLATSTALVRRPTAPLRPGMTRSRSLGNLRARPPMPPLTSRGGIANRLPHRAPGSAFMGLRRPERPGLRRTPSMAARMASATPRTAARPVGPISGGRMPPSRRLSAGPGLRGGPPGLGRPGVGPRMPPTGPHPRGALMGSRGPPHNPQLGPLPRGRVPLGSRPGAGGRLPPPRGRPGVSGFPPRPGAGPAMRPAMRPAMKPGMGPGMPPGLPSTSRRPGAAGRSPRFADLDSKHLSGGSGMSRSGMPPLVRRPSMPAIGGARIPGSRGSLPPGAPPLGHRSSRSGLAAAGRRPPGGPSGHPQSRVGLPPLPSFSQGSAGLLRPTPVAPRPPSWVGGRTPTMAPRSPGAALFTKSPSMRRSKSPGPALRPRASSMSLRSRAKSPARR